MEGIEPGESGSVLIGAVGCGKPAEQGGSVETRRGPAGGEDRRRHGGVEGVQWVQAGRAAARLPLGAPPPGAILPFLLLPSCQRLVPLVVVLQLLPGAMRLSLDFLGCILRVRACAGVCGRVRACVGVCRRGRACVGVGGGGGYA